LSGAASLMAANLSAPFYDTTGHNASPAVHTFQPTSFTAIQLTATN